MNVKTDFHIMLTLLSTLYIALIFLQPARLDCTVQKLTSLMKILVTLSSNSPIYNVNET